MTTVFEEETEIGECGSEPANLPELLHAEPAFARISAHTITSISRPRGEVRFEHRCFLRRGEIIAPQPWVDPEIQLLNPAPRSPDSIVCEAARRRHGDFKRRLRGKFSEDNRITLA